MLDKKDQKEKIRPVKIKCDICTRMIVLIDGITLGTCVCCKLTMCEDCINIHYILNHVGLELIEKFIKIRIPNETLNEVEKIEFSNGREIFIYKLTINNV